MLSLLGCSTSADRYLGKGNQLFAAAKFQDASINYRNAIKKDTHSVEAFHKLGMSEFALGKVDQAIASLTQARRLAPTDASVLEDLADVTFNRYLTSGRAQILYDSVTAMVKEILAGDPTSITGLRLHASLLYGDGKLKEAIETFQKANAITPFDPAIVLPWAEALRIDNRASEGEALALQLASHDPTFVPIYEWLTALYVSGGRMGEAEKILKSRIANNPRDFRANLVLAIFYRSQHRESEAKDLVEQAAAKSTDVPDRYSLAGDYYLSVRDWANAENCFREGIKTEPAAKALYWTRLATVYAKQKRNSEAMQFLGQAVKEQPDNWRAQAMRVSLLVISQDPEQVDQGIAMANGFARQRPNDGRFPALLAQAYAAKGNTQLAASYYQQAARLDKEFLEPRIALARISKEKRDYSGIIGYTEEVLEVAPQDIEARLLHAWAWMGQGMFPDAEMEMQSLLRDFPDSDEAKLQAGLLYLAERKSRASIEIFNKLLKTAPGDQRVLAGLASAYVQQKSFDSAIELVSREVQKDPTSDAKRQLLANLTEKLGRIDLSLQEFKSLSRAHPNVAGYHFEIGKLYEFLGDRANAVLSFENATRLAPQDATKQGRLAVAYYAAEKLEQAEAAYVRSVSLDPNDPVLLNNRAYFLAETGRNPDEALRLAQAALLKVPDNPALLDTLALAYIKKGQGNHAVTILDRLVRTYPDEPMFRYHRAMALAQQGERAAARKELEASLTKHPSKQDQLKIRELMSKLG